MILPENVPAYLLQRNERKLNHHSVCEWGNSLPLLLHNFSVMYHTSFLMTLPVLLRRLGLPMNWNIQGMKLRIELKLYILELIFLRVLLIWTYLLLSSQLSHFFSFFFHKMSKRVNILFEPLLLNNNFVIPKKLKW